MMPTTTLHGVGVITILYFVIFTTLHRQLMVMLGSAERGNFRLISREIIFQEFQPIRPGYLNVTRRMDGRTTLTTCHGNTALYIASRGKNSYHNYDSWARPRGAQLSAGYTVFSTPVATLFLRRAAYFDFTSVPCHCPGAPRCDLLRTNRWTDTRHDCDRHDLPASHSSSTQLKAGNKTCNKSCKICKSLAVHIQYYV